MKNSAKINFIVHLFAIAHAVLVVICYNLHLRDHIPLTVLTIAMIIIIARTYYFPIDVTSALALLGTFAGFYLGTKGAEIIIDVFNEKVSVPWSNAISTIVVTEIIGWIIFLIVRKNMKKSNYENY